MTSTRLAVVAVRGLHLFAPVELLEGVAIQDILEDRHTPVAIIAKMERMFEVTQGAAAKSHLIVLLLAGQLN